MAERVSNGLTIGELADRTGVPRATLRSWEARYGFPVPTRLPGGHRRYPRDQVEAIQRVVQRREEGFPMRSAVDEVLSEPLESRSVYAELRRRHPELAAQVLSKRTLLALSRALEDECCARALEPVLFAGFQESTHLEESLRRWVDLARTARETVVFARTAEAAAAVPAPLVLVDLADDAPLKREWFVICAATDLPACMAAVEMPGGGVDMERRFEMVWTVDPAIVHEAARVAAALAENGNGQAGVTALIEAKGKPAPASADLARAAGLLDRMLGYVERSR